MCHLSPVTCHLSDVTWPPLYAASIAMYVSGGLVMLLPLWYLILQGLASCLSRDVAKLKARPRVWAETWPSLRLGHGPNSDLFSEKGGQKSWLTTRETRSPPLRIYSFYHHLLRSLFSKHWSSGPRLSISRFVRLCVCLFVYLSFCFSICSLWGTVLTSFFPHFMKSYGQKC